MIADTFNREFAKAAKEMNAASPDTKLVANAIHLPASGEPALCYLVNQNNPVAMSAVNKVCEAVARAHTLLMTSGIVVMLSAEEMDALKDPDEFRSFPPPSI